MILFADTSALVKKYIQEPGSEQVTAFFKDFDVIGAAAITKVEMAAALGKALRMGWVSESMIDIAWQDFISHWPTYTRIPINPGIVDRSTMLAWQHGLRAYDAIQLGCALSWQDAIGEPVTFACFDKRLREAALHEALVTWSAAGL